MWIEESPSARSLSRPCILSVTSERRVAASAELSARSFTFLAGDATRGLHREQPRRGRAVGALTDVIEAYERQRWPLGRIPGGKG